MKKLLLMFLALSVLAVSTPVSAHERDGHPGNRDNKKHHMAADRNSHHRDMPWQWNERRDRVAAKDHRMERIHDREFNHRFHGLTAYRWQNHHHKGFWYKGHYIKDAVLFFNSSDELVRIGYMHDGVFIVIHADHSRHDHRDPYFALWWNR